jgi:Ger(x)C family germination protein
MKSKKYLILIILILGSIFYFQSNITFIPAEELSILSGIGMDLSRDEEGKIEYSVPISIYNYSTEPNTTSYVILGKGETLGETRESRQLKLDKKLLLGLERVVIAHEDVARFGILQWTDVLFANPNVNDTGYFIVTKDKTEDVLNLKIEGYASSGDYIEGVIRNSVEQNFFTKRYTLLDLYYNTTNEGNNLVSPYMEIINKLPTITGMAIFKGYRMVRKIDIKESSSMNLLRENNVRGTISVQENLKNYTDVYTTSKKKVKVNKEGDKYKFNINLDIEGYIISNLLYENPVNKPENLKKIESEVKKEIEKMTSSFINKMQAEYKVDCLNLGKYAVAKYGRHKGIDWNAVVSNSDINVNVKVKLSVRSRGQLK